MLAQTTRGQLGAPSFRVLCERGKPSHVADTPVREIPFPTKDLRISGLPRMLRRNLVQSKPGTARLLVLEPALSEAEGCRTASLSHRHSEWLQPRGICC